MRLKVDTSDMGDIRSQMLGIREKHRVRIMKNALRAAGRIYKKRLVGVRMNVQTGSLRRGYRQAYVAARGGIRKDSVVAWVATRRKGTGAYHAHLYEWGTGERYTTRRTVRDYRPTMDRMDRRFFRRHGYLTHTKKTGKLYRGRMPALGPMAVSLVPAWPAMKAKIDDLVDKGIRRSLETPSHLTDQAFHRSLR